MYTNTLTAKKDYHLLVANLLKEHIQRLHNNVFGTPTMVRPGKTRHHATICRHESVTPLIREV